MIRTIRSSNEIHSVLYIYVKCTLNLRGLYRVEERIQTNPVEKKPTMQWKKILRCSGKKSYDAVEENPTMQWKKRLRCSEKRKKMNFELFTSLSSMNKQWQKALVSILWEKCTLNLRGLCRVKERTQTNPMGKRTTMQWKTEENEFRIIHVLVFDE
jgi:hypothetical protein